VDLDWAPTHNFSADMVESVNEYMSTGRVGKTIDFSKDDAILDKVMCTTIFRILRV
jgi:hypothetical protein